MSNGTILVIAMLLKTLIALVIMIGLGYVVFVLGHNPWWFLLAVPAACIGSIDMKVGPSK